MNNNNISGCYKTMTERTYKIAGDLEVRLTLTSNTYEIPLDSLFNLAARINKKRSFLFVSKVLGKHIPLNPYTSLLSGASLALLLQQALEGDMPKQLVQRAIQGIIEPTLSEAVYKEILSHQLRLPQSVAFIGFAETATAIGHAVYETFGHGSNYIHTTREEIEEYQSIINFSEEHSHAVDHFCYAQNPQLLTNPDIVVLVDDEITTGKTSLNIIRDMQRIFPKKIYYVLALLDWRTEENQQQFQKLEIELGISIHVLSLVKGKVKVSGTSESLTPQVPVLPQADYTVPIQFTYIDHQFVHAPSTKQRPYLQHSGRFGLTPDESRLANHSISQAAQQLKLSRIGTKTLCVGTGEFMYIPMRIAAEMGEGISYQSTTRSPIHTINREDYAVKVGYPYPSPEDPSVTHFIYNIPVGWYDDLYVFMEREADPALMQPFLQILQTRGFKSIQIVFFSPQTIKWEESAVWKIGELNK